MEKILVNGLTARWQSRNHENSHEPLWVNASRFRRMDLFVLYWNVV